MICPYRASDSSVLRVESIVERWLFQFIRSTAGPMAGEEKVWLSTGIGDGAGGCRLQATGGRRGSPVATAAADRTDDHCRSPR